ncbi:serine/threonine-protein kinase [Mycobacterium sp. 155]|uniref:serine/threonine-protein kinase n=1 Tax=Mycobacterium sp. 155 TaxID=1157943 RepID=UPI000371F27F|nr:serine/threonine-protein kinase [Mycobacterium sp. 155]
MDDDGTVIDDGDVVPDPVGEFGRYELLSLLGAGGMGQVWRARDSRTNRVVALKVLPEHSADDKDLRERFRRECRAVAQLTDPHVIPIHDFGDIDGRLYLNMRLVDGTDLRTLIKREGPLSPRRAVAIIGQVAGALQAAHDAGLVHRDVKPSNIVVCANDFVYLIDFGVTHAAEDQTLTRVGETIGTAAYMAPAAVGAAVKTHSGVDVYALACVLYECLTGRQPFTSDMGVQGVIAHHLHTPPPPPSTDNPDIPTGFDAVIAKGMAKNPEDRYQTVRELAAAARAALEDSVVPQPRQRFLLSPKTIKIALAAAVVVVVAAGVVIVAGRFSVDGGGGSDAPVPQAPAQTALPFNDVRLATGIAVDAAGDTYVADIGTDRVLRLAAGAPAAVPLPLSGLSDPRGLAVDAAGDVYVSDSGNNRVLQLPAGATAAVPLPFSDIRAPQAVAVDAQGNVYITDIGSVPVIKLAGN